jgi:hypothetical protein
VRWFLELSGNHRELRWRLIWLLSVYAGSSWLVAVVACGRDDLL